ncbi:hypothetical protein FSP39_023357 [Pinctada imbricata]|uniref:C2H2-type domain-containing protein n=1 Tax=Pinctada imbricata TaxID=66713 RepID=A0AA88YG36_PINIB|nr:hypothetical protein FSP39_023357 [Pinctada imbricata]
MDAARMEIDLSVVAQKLKNLMNLLGQLSAYQIPNNQAILLRISVHLHQSEESLQRALRVLAKGVVGEDPGPIHGLNLDDLTRDDNAKRKNEEEGRSVDYVNGEMYLSQDEDGNDDMPEDDSKKIEKPYKCSQCDETFGTKFHLAGHEQSHAAKSYKCSDCNEEFSTSTEWTLHLKKHKLSLAAKCNCCNKVLSTRKALLKHYKRVHPKYKAFKCNECPKRFKFFADLMEHKKAHAEGVTEGESAKDAGEKIKKESEEGGAEDGEKKESDRDDDDDDMMEEEMVDHKTHNQPKKKNPLKKKPRPATCKVCGKVLSNRKAMLKHIRQVHPEENGYQCNKCDEAFKTFDELRLHKKIHMGEKIHQCEWCDQSFADKYSLTTHTRKHVNQVLRPYKCEQCGKSFTHKWTLDKHVKRHSTDRPFECTVCKKTFVFQEDLNAHSQFHSDNIYPCTLCDKVFNHKRTLANHMVRHSGIRTNVCEMCGKSFYTKHALMMHIRCHTGEKPAVCEICGKGFRARNYLRNHMLMHSGEKPHMCSVCGKSFSRKDNLRQHMQTHSGIKSFTCDQCGKGFGRKKMLEKHMESHGVFNEVPTSAEVAAQIVLNKKDFRDGSLVTSTATTSSSSLPLSMPPTMAPITCRMPPPPSSAALSNDGSNMSTQSTSHPINTTGNPAGTPVPPPWRMPYEGYPTASQIETAASQFGYLHLINSMNMNQGNDFMM